MRPSFEGGETDDGRNGAAPHGPAGLALAGAAALASGCGQGRTSAPSRPAGNRYGNTRSPPRTTDTPLRARRTPTCSRTRWPHPTRRSTRPSKAGSKRSTLRAASCGNPRTATTTRPRCTGAPHVMEDTLYTVRNEPDGHGTLQALDPGTGRLRWSFSGGGWLSPPAASGGHVAVSSTDHLHGLDAATGKERWRACGDGAGCRRRPRDRRWRRLRGRRPDVPRRTRRQDR
ncbi:PQQ-binding-like beta-propeller repeat protein [Spirillospora sp. NPDC046719]